MAGKRSSTIYYRIFGCYLSYILLGLLVVGLNFRTFWLASPLFFLFIIVPALDASLEKDQVSIEKSDLNSWQIAICRIAPYGFIVGYICILFSYIRTVSHFTFFEFLIGVISMGAVGSIAITASHELIHKKSKVARFFARLGLLSVINLHFEYYHLHGHHREAATMKDNHTARLGETFPEYLVRTTKGAMSFICAFEYTRLQRLGIAWANYQNKIFWFFGTPSLIVIAISLIGGLTATLFFLIQAIIAILSLEAVSYIEHYGLLRKNINGQREFMDDRHSWDSYHRFSNYITFMLQRHADHHLNSTKDYFLLRSNHQSPELPVGYPLLILLVNFPPQWFKIIHPRANLQDSEINSLSSQIRGSL